MLLISAIITLSIPILCSANERVENLSEKIFIKLFKQTRKEQIEAIKHLRALKKEEKQYKLINLMSDKVFTTIEECRAKLEASGYIPGVSEFPSDENVRDCLSNILENTALFSDVVLRFPEYSEQILKNNNKWDILLQWSIAFSYQVKYLIDKSTLKLLNLVSQELNHTEREENYFNPYRKRVKVEYTNDDELVKKKKEKKKKLLRKGPRLANFGDL